MLLNLFKECSAEGKLKAAHGLVKLGSHCDPNIAFTGEIDEILIFLTFNCFIGQRMYEVVKPAVQLIHPDIVCFFTILHSNFISRNYIQLVLDKILSESFFIFAH